MSREISQNLIEKWARENPSLEISLWLEKTKNENGKIVKCKACTHFESDEISGMASFKKTWIDGYTGARLVALKEHCNGKPHMKALRSSKASVLKMPAEVGQKDIDTSVSADEMKRLERKANIAYFAAKNDIPFRKFQGLVELVHKEGNLNFEKDIGTLYVNKDGCREFISAHGEVTVQNVAEVVSKWMDQQFMGKKRKVFLFSRFSMNNSSKEEIQRLLNCSSSQKFKVFQLMRTNLNLACIDLLI